MKFVATLLSTGNVIFYVVIVYGVRGSVRVRIRSRPYTEFSFGKGARCSGSLIVNSKVQIMYLHAYLGIYMHI